MQRDTETLLRLRQQIDEMRRLPLSHLSTHQQDLDALLTLVQAEDWLAERDEQIERRLQRTTLPVGYSLTRSGGRYGYRRGAGATIEWSGNPYSARRAAWVHFEMAEEAIQLYKLLLELLILLIHWFRAIGAHLIRQTPPLLIHLVWSSCR